MKKFIYLLIICSFLPKISFSSDFIYDTSFYNVNINNEFIDDAKLREINNIKRLSFESVLSKILTEDNFNKFKGLVNIEEEINYIIKNIIIEEEFISSKKYKAKIKINFDYKEIVELLRINKINYTDYKSSKFLIIVAENTEFSHNGLSKSNSFYNGTIENDFNLISIEFPDLSLNDRFILPYEKILTKDLSSLNNIGIKYGVNNIFLIIFNKNKDIYDFNINVFSSYDNRLENIDKLFFNSNLNYQVKLLSFLNNWWKKNNLINNSVINKNSCIIKNSNLHELQFINSKINSISQVKSNILNQINLGSNIQDIVFYGDISNLSSKLLNEKIILQFNINNECIIFTSN